MRGVGVALALLVGACATTEQGAWPAGAPPTEETVGWIDERPVTYGDVARYLRTKDPESFARGLEGLVIERVTVGEAKSIGLTVPRALVDREASKRMVAWEKNVRAASREQTGEEIEPALWLQRVAGVSLAEFRSWVEHHTEVELIQDRLVRYEELSSPHVEVSLILLEDEARAPAVLAEARKDFPAAAKANSVHPSAPEGGRVEGWVLPGDVADPKVRKALFAAKAGDIVGPFPGRGEKGSCEIYRLEASSAARKGTYAELNRDITRELETRPVHVAEYERWRTRVLVRHGFLSAEGGIE